VEPLIFRPPRRVGLLYHLALIATFSALMIVGLQFAAEAELGAIFMVALSPMLVGFFIIPLLIYRTYALWTATYTIERDGLRLQWGLRVEEIPMNAIRWLHPEQAFSEALPIPWPRLPGAVLGVRRRRDGQTVEFMAAQSRGLILIATAERIFAISPRLREEFLQAYRSEIELGSFASRPARSIQPAAILANFWPDPWARGLVFGMVLFNLVLLGWASFLAATHITFPFRFDATGKPLETAPAVRLMLLPITSILMGLIDLLLGLFFYRRAETKIAAYWLWLAGLATCALFLGAIYFLQRAI
jgi:hypothetical protein